MTAPHQHRQGTTTKRRKQHGPALEYPAGFFTELIFEHRWPPRFESRGNWQSSRHAPPHVIAAQSRSGEGFSANPIGLAGAKDCTTRFEAHRAREAKG